MIKVDKPYKQLLKSSWIDKSKGYVWVYVRGHRHGKPLHRVIMESYLGKKLSPKEEIDHKNQIKTDCRIKNLRVTNRSGNCINRNGWGKLSKGVRKMGKNFQARIGFNKKSICLGVYKTERQAINAYNKAAKKIHGEYRRLS